MPNHFRVPSPMPSDRPLSRGCVGEASRSALPTPFRPARVAERFGATQQLSAPGAQWTGGHLAAGTSVGSADRAMSPTVVPRNVYADRSPSPCPRAVHQWPVNPVHVAPAPHAAPWQTPPVPRQSPLVVRRCISPTVASQPMQPATPSMPCAATASTSSQRCASPCLGQGSQRMIPIPLLSDHGMAELKTPNMSRVHAGASPRDFRSKVVEDMHVRIPTPQPQVAAPSSSPQQDLSQGVAVCIGDISCWIRKPLGVGSFGEVWAAEDSNGSPLAIKEIICSSQADLLNALFEGHLLRTVGGDRGSDAGAAGGGGGPRRAAGASRCAGRVPALMACETKQLAPEQWRIRLVMTRIYGEALDSFFRRCQDQPMRSSTSWASLAGQFRVACGLAKEMMLQLGPSFEEIASVAFHRDANSHNILIDAASLGNGGTPRFGLVDFGLAVDVSCWQKEDGMSPIGSRPSRVGQDGACTWHHLDVGGDCRYWPVSAWVQFLLGWTELEAHPSWSFEYQTQLDFHSVGLTALQLLIEYLSLSQAEVLASRRASRDSNDGGIVLMNEIYSLQLSWDRYWNTVTPWHSRLMDTFHNGGDWDVLKTECLNTDVQGTIAERLRDLRSAMSEVGHACRNASLDAETRELSAVFSALLLLVSSGDQEPQVACQGPGRWREVIMTLSTGCSGDALETPPRGLLGGGFPKTTSMASTASTLGGQAAGAPQGQQEQQRRQRLHSGEAPALGSAAEPPCLAPDAGVTSGSPQPRPFASQVASAEKKPFSQSPNKAGDDMMLRLSHLRDRVDWLAREMTRLGEPGDGIVDAHASVVGTGSATHARPESVVLA